MDSLDIELATISFLKSFEDDLEALTVKLLKRYKDKPKDDITVVCNVTANLCARLIINTAPKDLWQPMMVNIAMTMAGVIKKEGGK